MNLELLNPGHQFEVPARLDCELLPPEYQNDNLISPTPTTMSFNRRGHYLAMGYSDGRVLIFDFNTRLGNETEGAGLGVVPALTLNAHEAEVVAVSWTRRARGLLTAGRDGAIRLWDLTVVSDESEVAATLRTRCVAEVQFNEACIFAMLHPRDNVDALCTNYRHQSTHDCAEAASGTGTAPITTPVRCVVLLKSGILILTDIQSGSTHSMVGSSTDAASLNTAVSPAASVNDSGSDVNGNADTNHQCSSREAALDGAVTAVTLDTKGSWIFVGTSKGNVYAAKMPANDLSMSCSATTRSVHDGGPQISKASDPAVSIDPAVAAGSVLNGDASTDTTMPIAKKNITASQVRWVRVAAHPPSALLELKCSKDGRFLVANYGDKTLRLFDAPALSAAASKQIVNCDVDSRAATTSYGDASVAELSTSVGSNFSESKKCEKVLVRPRLSLRDLVESRAWVTCGFSHDGERIVGGTLEKSSYHLFHWDTDNGNLARRVSSGPGRPLSCLAWHPARNFAACGTRNGPVMIWGTDLKWEAFAPDFELIEENEEYFEKEDEFDTVISEAKDGEPNNGYAEGTQGSLGAASTEHLGRKSRKDYAEESLDSENEDVDVCGVKRLPAFASDSEDESSVFYVRSRVGCAADTHAKQRARVMEP